MKADQLEQELQAARRHLETLRRQIEATDPQQTGVTATLGSLSTSLEQLQAAGDLLSRAGARAETEYHRYQSMFEKAPAGYLVTDPHGMILEANLAAAELLHTSPEELAGTALSDLVSNSQTAQKVIADQIRRLEQAPGDELEIHLQPEKGEPFLAVLRATPLRDTNGELIGLRWLVRDVTERRRMAMERRELLVQVEEQRRRAEKLASETQMANNLLHALIYTSPWV